MSWQRLRRKQCTALIREKGREGSGKGLMTPKIGNSLTHNINLAKVSERKCIGEYMSSNQERKRCDEVLKVNLCLKMVLKEY